MDAGAPISLRESFVRALAEAIAEDTTDSLVLRPHQRVENARRLDGTVCERWKTWLLMAGRGAGKTLAGACYVNEVMSENREYRLAIIAPTFGDALESCVYGASGLKSVVNPRIRVRQKAGGTTLAWPNGAHGRIFGTYTSEDIERLRAGGNRHLVWAEELAAWRYLKEAWEMMQLGLRLGSWPRVVATTTPKPRREFIDIVKSPTTVLTRGTIFDNPGISEDVKQTYRERYEGTRLGLQELHGELIEDVEGALWTYEMIEVEKAPADFDRVVVAVDPAVTAGEDSDETGIIVAGRVGDIQTGVGYVLSDESGRYTPEQAAAKISTLYDAWQADAIVVEVNNGGDYIEALLRAYDGRQLPVRQVRATRGKTIRAEPIATLYARRRIKHARRFHDLETQMTTMVPGQISGPADRADALVWAFTDLFVRASVVRVL